MRVYIPGNLLLLGEYAITVSGGKGIGLAVDAAVKIESEQADLPPITCNFQGVQYQWIEGSPFPEKLRLIECILKDVSKHLKEKGISSSNFPIKITIDSSNFYYDSGRKKGYGSSAAVTVGLTYLLLHHAYSKAPDLVQDLFPLALSIHRGFQGGKGSGYDIATSLFGSAGLFTGGSLPTWEPITTPWMESLYITRGDDEASTEKAVSRFNQYKEKNPEESTYFLKESNDLVEKMAACKNLPSAKDAFEKGSALNRWIHEKIGISSEAPQLHQLLQNYRAKGYPGKALGAGGEIAAVLMTGEDNLLQGESCKLEPLKISNRGLRCEL